MNERNVEALTEALVRYAERNGSRREDALPSSRRIAESIIASDGVLMPSALSDVDCARLTADWDCFTYMGLGIAPERYTGPDDGTEQRQAEGAAIMRAHLERIAKGAVP